MPAPTVHEHGRVDLAGGQVFIGFPGRSQVGPLVAAYLSEAFGLKPVAFVDHPELPPMAVVEKGRIVQLIEIDAGKTPKHGSLAVVESEIPIENEHMRPMAQALFEWCQRKDAKRILCAEGFGSDLEPDVSELVETWAISTDPKRNARMQKAGLAVAHEGVVAGISGVLLGLGARHGLEVVAVMSRSHGPTGDIGAATATLEMLATACDLPIDKTRLRRQATAFEKQLQQRERRQQLRQGREDGGRSEDFV